MRMWVSMCPLKIFFLCLLLCAGASPGLLADCYLIFLRFLFPNGFSSEFHFSTLSLNTGSGLMIK